MDLERLRVVKKIFNAKTGTEAVNKALDLAIDSTRIRKIRESIKDKGKIKDIYGGSSS